MTLIARVRNTTLDWSQKRTSVECRSQKGRPSLMPWLQDQGKFTSPEQTIVHIMSQRAEMVSPSSVFDLLCIEAIVMPQNLRLIKIGQQAVPEPTQSSYYETSSKFARM